jgi:vancomycin resistance protein VanJ
LVLLPLSLLARHWRVAMTLTPAVLLFVSAYGGRFIPRTVAHAAEAPTFKMLTYNLHAEVDHLDGIIQVIRDANADIVTVQELSYPAAARFAAELSALYPYQALHPRHYPNAGQGVLSRFPLWDDVYWHNTKPPDSLGHMSVKVLIQGVTVNLFNTHPLRPVLHGIAFDDGPRRKEIADVLNRAAKVEGPILIAGDFNMTDQTGDYFRITERFKDTYAEVGWGLGLTFPDAYPSTAPTQWLRRAVPVPLFMRLDYIFHTAQFQAIQANVWPSSGGSDHHPVLVELALLAQPETEVIWR